MIDKKPALVEGLEIEPLSDEALTLVSGRADDTSGFPGCCSCFACSMWPPPDCGSRQ
jgi:hypothetical protein